MSVQSTPEPQRISASPIDRWENAGKLEETGDKETGDRRNVPDICLTRLVWLTAIGDFQGKGDLPSVPAPQPEVPSGWTTPG
jgi:hypothetical protein